MSKFQAVIHTASLVSSSVGVLSNTNNGLFGVAGIAAASTIGDVLFDIRGGGSSSSSDVAVVPKKEIKEATERKQFLSFLTPKGKATVYMAVAMACHYLGYSIARPITISLFTSSKTGYAGSNAAFPFAMTFISPVSLMLLLGYGNMLDKFGPKGALKGSTVICGVILCVAATIIELLAGDAFSGSAYTAFSKLQEITVFSIPLIKYVSGPLFIFRESYVQLLTSQYWSFMSSALTPSQSAKWFAPIAGLTSITSAIAGILVSSIVDKVGLSGALACTGAMLIISLYPATAAYNIAEQHGFSPKQKQDKKQQLQQEKKQNVGMIKKANDLFHRVPVLWALFLEILASQGLATVLNVAFVSKLGQVIPDDAERAKWVGKFFSTINCCSMVLQFGFLPPLLSVIEPKILWRIIPSIALAFTVNQSFFHGVDPSLRIISTTLLVMKTLEYSVRRLLDEMVFVPLDFESRYVGKEIISVFGFRFGKSLMSLLLSGISSLTSNVGIFSSVSYIQQLSIMSTFVSSIWLKQAWKLSNFVPTKKEAEEIYKHRK